MRRAELLPLGVVLALATLFRLPALLAAGAINSDAAVVGLHARHILHGEWTWHLWGTGYQGSVDSLLVAIAIAILGSRPIAVFVVPFVGLLAMVTLAWDVLRRHLGSRAAAMCAMPLVFAPMASNLPMVYVMRQTLATTLTLGVWLAERAWRTRAGTRDSARGAARSRAPSRGAALLSSAACFALGFYIDTFAVVVYPAAAVLWLASAREDADVVALLDGDRLGRPLRVAKIAVPMLLAIFVALCLVVRPLRDHVGGNLELLLGTCLPFALGTKVFVPGEELVARAWSAPLPLLAVQIVGAAVFVASLLFAGYAAKRAEIPARVRLLGLFGFVVVVTTFAAFVASTRPVDMWSSRYLAPIFWTSPFTLAPLAYVLGARRFAFAEVAYWVTALVGGWVSYGPFVDGPLPRIDARAAAVEERALRDALVAEGVHHAKANYWLAYRLSFLWSEDPVVVPLEPGDDRYPPHRKAVEAAAAQAFLFHPSEPRAMPGPVEAQLQAAGVPFEKKVVSGFTVLVVRRSTPPGTSGNSAAK